MGRSLRHEVVSMLNEQRKIDFGEGSITTLRDHLGARIGDGPEQYIAVESDDIPIYWVNWEQASEYCQRLTDQERRVGHRQSPIDSASASSMGAKASSVKLISPLYRPGVGTGTKGRSSAMG